MARNDGIDRTVARNRDLKKSATLESAQAHNERQKECYSNPDIVPERTPLNIHYKTPTGSYEDMFAELVEKKIISTWGLKPDSTRLCELVFDVNSGYFYNHGGYEFAKQFYADAYEAAVKIVDCEQYILSAVLHADERNRAMSEALGEDVYHYHLHVVYVPVVKKDILWSKRCKDPALVGTIKETVMQVSRSKKWESRQATDENGEPMVTASGKKVLKKSYSVLQDDFHQYMLAAGYTDLERGERGSTEEHLTVTQFKVQQERQRLAEIAEKEEQAKANLAQLEQQTAAAQQHLNAFAPKMKNAEDFVRTNISTLEELLPEAGTLERAKSYREEKALPLIRKLKKLMLSLYRTILDLRQKLDDLKLRLDRAERDRDYFREKADALRERADDLNRVKCAIGAEQIEAAISRERGREEAEKAAKTAARRVISRDGPELPS